jgi:hypothetical protein
VDLIAFDHPVLGCRVIFGDIFQEKASCTTDTRALCWEYGDVDHPPPSSAEIKERVELYLHSPSVISWSVHE